MENFVYALSHDKWKSLMISGGTVYLSSKRHDNPADFTNAINKK
jgi:hypothetical protein